MKKTFRAVKQPVQVKSAEQIQRETFNARAVPVTELPNALLAPVSKK